MNPESFHCHLKERVAVLSWKRPEVLNALTFEVYREMRDLFASLKRNDEVRAVVLTGQGRGFCSGGDVRDIIGPLQSQKSPRLTEFTRLTCDVVANIRALPKPVIAAVQGPAAGAGAALALACDLRLCSPEASFSFLFVKMGLAGADMGAAHLLPKLVGAGRAAELLFLGEPVDAATAQAWGLVNRVVPSATLMEEALAWAKRLADGPTFALGITKELLGAEDAGLATALRSDAHAQALCLGTDDFAEGYRAFLEKRAPRFSGK
jgi:enoyl-CoA hydratase/carnithine racemase